jgi:hypothetical protein
VRPYSSSPRMASKWSDQPASSTRYTDARPMLRAFATSDGPRPCAFIARTWAASIEPEPRARLKSRHEFGHSWNLWQPLPARRGGHRQRPKLPVPDERD